MPAGKGKHVPSSQSMAEGVFGAERPKREREKSNCITSLPG
jgi:hypothetical protein